MVYAKVLIFRNAVFKRMFDYHRKTTYRSNLTPMALRSILVEVASDHQIWMENRRVDIRAVRANIQRLLAEDPEAPVTIKVEKGAEAGIVVDVADAARESGVGAVNWASDR